MSGRMEALCLRFLDLARGQKAALETGNLDDVLALIGKRQEVLREIQEIDGFPGASGTDGEPASIESVLREILTVDREAEGVAREGLRDVSEKLGRINTFKVLCRGAVDGARDLRTLPVP